MIPIKTTQELEIFNRYKHWLSFQGIIPTHIVGNYKIELRRLQISQKN